MTSEISALGYIAFETQKMAEWKRFAPEVLGLQISEEKKRR